MRNTNGYRWILKSKKTPRVDPVLDRLGHFDRKLYEPANQIDTTQFMKTSKNARKISPKDKFSLQRAAMILGISRDTLRRRLFAAGVEIVPGRTYTRSEINGSLWGTRDVRLAFMLDRYLPDGTEVSE